MPLWQGSLVQGWQRTPFRGVQTAEPAASHFAEGAFSRAFVPILAEYKSKQGEDATRVFVSYVSGLLTLALAVVTVVGMLAAPGSLW